MAITEKTISYGAGPFTNHTAGHGHFPSDPFAAEWQECKLEFEKECASQKLAEPGSKHDAGKVPLELLPFEALIEVARVLEYGARKYSAHNWRKGMSYSRLAGAAFRHLFAWTTGVQRDPETGLSHLAHAACCVLFLLSYTITGSGRDDRVIAYPTTARDPRPSSMP